MATVIEELTERSRARSLARLLQDAAEFANQIGYQAYGAKLKEMETTFLRKIVDGEFDEKE